MVCTANDHIMVILKTMVEICRVEKCMDYSPKHFFIFDTLSFQQNASSFFVACWCNCKLKLHKLSSGDHLNVRLTVLYITFSGWNMEMRLKMCYDLYLASLRASV